MMSLNSKLCHLNPCFWVARDHDGWNEASPIEHLKREYKTMEVTLSSPERVGNKLVKTNVRRGSGAILMKCSSISLVYE